MKNSPAILSNITLDRLLNFSDIFIHRYRVFIQQCYDCKPTTPSDNAVKLPMSVAVTNGAANGKRSIVSVVADGTNGELVAIPPDLYPSVRLLLPALE